MLRLENFRKTFPGNIGALQDVSLEVKAGEFLVVLGPSGSGKTTLLRAINGLETVDGGALYFKGRRYTEWDSGAFRKNFGMIFQHFNLVESLKVINNVLTGALARTNGFASLFYLFPRRLRLQALECLERVQILDKAYEKTRSLSGGQKQRVGIARAIMQEPSVILADEPIANLDPMIAYNILRILKDICLTSKIAVICNLHQVDFALQFADRIICLAEGKIIVEGETGELNPEIIYQAYRGKGQGMFFKDGEEQVLQP